MNEILHAYYRENPQYASRKNTDTFFPFGGARLSYGGIADRMARWVEEHQLLDASLWQLFVDQFRGCPDDGDAGWRCEYWGKMMRGGALTYQYTRSPALYRTLTDTVLDMLSAQDPLGRFSTYSVGAEFDGWDLWGRKYILLGMLHYHEICRDEGLRALIVEACRRHADYIIARIGPGEGQKNITAASRHWGGINSSSILEPMMRLYGETGTAATWISPGTSWKTAAPAGATFSSAPWRESGTPTAIRRKKPTSSCPALRDFWNTTASRESRSGWWRCGILPTGS